MPLFEESEQDSPISMDNAENVPSLPEMIEEAVLVCPIDTRRALYSNIVLSVCGTTMGVRQQLILGGTMPIDSRLRFKLFRVGTRC